MTEPTPLTYVLKDLFPKASPQLLRLLEAAAENAGLLRGDYFTIRDWLEIADYEGEESVVVLLLVLMLSLEEGSLCVTASAESIAGRLTDLVGADEAIVWAQRLLDDVTRDGFPRLIGAAPGDNRPVIRCIIGERVYFYFQKYVKAEREVYEQFQRQLQKLAATEMPANLAEVLHDVLVERPLRAGGRALQLDHAQQLAIGAALLRNLTIVSGGPGTGKTSIVLTLLRCLVRCGYRPERIALAAPTGRAAQRLGDALRLGLDRVAGAQDDGSPDRCLSELSASTLHQLLAYRPSRNLFGRHAENPIPADVVIVDEVSMVGLVLMSQLLQALASGAKLILLGDKDQLPSVEAGAVLASLVPNTRVQGFSPELARQLAALFPAIEVPVSTSERSLRDCVVLLETNHRSQQQIRDAALAINRRDADVIDRLPVLTLADDAQSAAAWERVESAGGCWLLEQTLATPAELRGFLHSWADHVYFQPALGGASLGDFVGTATLPNDLAADAGAEDVVRELFARLERFRLLTLVREGPWGSVEINRFFDQKLRPRLDPAARGGLFAGAPVLITRNDPMRQLNNGDVGLALTHADGLRVVFPRQGSFVAFSEDALPAHELGFALTIHKSQGSEYGHVLVVLPPEGGRRLLTKELVYTAITRAKSLAVLCGTRQVLRLAIGRQIVREAGMLQSLA